MTNPWSCSRSLVWSSSSSSSRRRGERARKEDDSSADRRAGGKRGRGERARREDNSSADGLRRHRSLVFLSSRRGRCRLRRRSAWVLADIVLGSWHIFASHPPAGATAPSAMRMKVSLPSSTSWRDGPRCNEGKYAPLTLKLKPCCKGILQFQWSLCLQQIQLLPNQE